ncbi:hypothetical protein, partial [Pseudomonas aeruginosa]|uniref:hypothetical protein n=1 Tax=Pseudomonas aeruginosa TaxID=287 RepID=UPI001F2F31B5
TDKAATVNEVPKNHLTVVNRFFDEAKLSVTFPEKSTFSTESARSSRSIWAESYLWRCVVYY